MHRIFATAAVAALTACSPVEQLADYRPVADAAGPAYERDLTDCRAIATQAEADYRKREADAVAANIFAGLIVGAIAGQAIGGNSDWTAYGAAHGAATGAASADTELAYGGPRRIIDRCMTGRGHRILSDLGRG